MRPLSYQNTLAIFVLFFGVSVLDAFASGEWPRIAFWVLIAVAFALLAIRKPEKASK